jgi:hypothetical protein
VTGTSWAGLARRDFGLPPEPQPVLFPVDSAGRIGGDLFEDPPAPAPAVPVVPPGRRETWESRDYPWFEYHCTESDSSCDAELWHRSHQRVLLLGRDSDEDYPGSYAERAEAGMPRCYRIRFDGSYTGTATEDELFTDPAYFERPDPPDDGLRRAEMGTAATLRLMRVCQPGVPDWETSRADARTAVCLAFGVHPDDVDSLGYDRTPRAYRDVRRSWVSHIEQFGWNAYHKPDEITGIVADWAVYLPDLTAGDDWLADGTAAHLARYPDGPCESAIRGGCTLHDDDDVEDADG